MARNRKNKSSRYTNTKPTIKKKSSESSSTYRSFFSMVPALSMLMAVAAIFFSFASQEILSSHSKWDNFDGIAKISSEYKVLKVSGHDQTAFTQGLHFHNKMLVESTGLHGETLVRIWDPESGEVVRETPILDTKYFGEGLTFYQDENGNNRYIQLTWREQTAFVYNPTDLSLLSTFEYSTKTNEGWGITFDPNEKLFYVSDGSEYIHVWNLSFEEIHRFEVNFQVPTSEQGTREKLRHINELEWDPDDGTILANVWYQDIIVRVYPKTGQVVQVYDLSQLHTDRSPDEDCMNGIAYHSKNKFWITGKLWPKLYLIEVLE